MPFRCASTATQGVQYSATARPSKTPITPGAFPALHEIELLDPRVRVRAAEEHDVRQARKAQVVGEGAAALQQALRVRPRHALADVALVDLGAGGVERKLGLAHFYLRRDYFLDRVDDRLVAGAAAVVARDVRRESRRASPVVGCATRSCAAISIPGVQKPHCSALLLVERLLQIGELARVRQALDRVDLAAVRLHREHQAAAHDLAVDAQRARAAHAVLAADVRAGEAQLLAQEVDQVLARRDAAASPATPFTVIVV